MDLEYFMQKLSDNSPINKNSNFKKDKQLEKISLNYDGNFGMYQLFLLDSTVQKIPYITLYDTKEICIPRMGKGTDGSPAPYKTWIKLLPPTAYVMRDSTGRIVSSLSAADDELLTSARMLWDQLYQELDIKNNLQYQKEVARRRNYTVFHAYCISKWEMGGTGRAPVRTNFPGLFICTSKGLSAAISDNIESKTALLGSRAFLEKIYNRNQTGRTGFVLLTISKSKTSAGFQITTQHEFAENLASVTIPDEDFNNMRDPVANFLGWQANKEDESVPDDQRRLFNSVVVREAVDFITAQLNSIRAAKQNSTDVNEAIRITNEYVLKQQQQKQTNDPMLQNLNESTPTPNADLIKEQNTQPFQTPPASKMSPITGAPEAPNNSGFGSGFGGNNFGGFGNSNPTSTPFSSPFGNFGANNGGGSGDLPF